MISSLTIIRIMPTSIKLLKAIGNQNIQCCKHVRHIAPVSMMETTRFYSVKMAVDYEYTKKATKNPQVLIVDVREPDEVKEHGKIPNSINIPLGNISSALSLPESQFRDVFKTPKPTENTEMIFYCMIGKRSEKAQQEALKLGYKNAKNYLGSWMDWAKKQTEQTLI